MWELISFVAGMAVLMLLFALLPHVYELPDAIAKYFNRRANRSDAAPVPLDPDEAAARLLGESLRRGQLSSETAARVMAVFWAADARNRRALAQLVAGLAVDGEEIDEESLLAMVDSLRAAAAIPPERDRNPPASTAIRESPSFPK